MSQRQSAFSLAGTSASTGPAVRLDPPAFEIPKLDAAGLRISGQGLDYAALAGTLAAFSTDLGARMTRITVLVVLAGRRRPGRKPAQTRIPPTTERDAPCTTSNPSPNSTVPPSTRYQLSRLRG